jgi:hypothetical protein
VLVLAVVTDTDKLAGFWVLALLTHVVVTGDKVAETTLPIKSSMYQFFFFMMFLLHTLQAYPPSNCNSSFYSSDFFLVGATIS